MVTAPDGLPLAGPGPRLLARILDWIIVNLVGALIGLPLLSDALDIMFDYLDRVRQATATGAEVNAFELYHDPRYLSALSGLAMIRLAVSAVYHTSFVALRGATPGKVVVGVRVRPWEADRRPSWGQASLRWLGTDIGAVLPGVGVFYTLLDSFWLLRDDRRQCLHDKLPRTCVIRSGSRRGLTDAV